MARLFLLHYVDILGDTGWTLLCQLCITCTLTTNSLGFEWVQSRFDHVAGDGKNYQVQCYYILIIVDRTTRMQTSWRKSDATAISGPREARDKDSVPLALLAARDHGCKNSVQIVAVRVKLVNQLVIQSETNLYCIFSFRLTYLLGEVRATVVVKSL